MSLNPIHYVFFLNLTENKKTCSNIKNCNPEAKSGSYVIDPDGDLGTAPFTVHCDMTDKNEVGVPVVGYDSETRMLVENMERKEAMCEVFATLESA